MSFDLKISRIDIEEMGSYYKAEMNINKLRNLGGEAKGKFM